MARTIKKSGVRSQCRKRCRKEVCQILLTLPHLYLDQPHDFKQCEDEIRSHSAGCVQIIATRTTRKGKRCACVWMQRLRRKKKNASDTMEITLLVVLVFAFVMLRCCSRFRQNLHIGRIHELFWRPKSHVQCLAQSARMHFQSLGRTTSIGFLVTPPILAPVSNRCCLPCHNSSDLVHRRVLHH